MTFKQAAARPYHETTPGNAAYDPETQKKVPKYLTPTGASEILIAKPMVHITRPAKMNGDRFLIRSDHTANSKSIMAVMVREAEQITIMPAALNTYWHRRKEAQSKAD